ncbi:YxiJ-like family protein [Neobacillus mesonae]|nr:YxiJ-like family protein [Neobacillus mesonae]
MDKMVHELKSIELDNPFPHRDSDKIQEDFRSAFMKLRDEENSLNCDFNTYCMNIAGTLSYVLTGKIENIPHRQRELLEHSFFNWYPQYKFIEGSIGKYTEFFKEYENFEKARLLLLDYLEAADKGLR